ncbi:MAG TPA: PEP/pyruvate-binding domain-containing protein, partial [Humisphaera sp.]
MGSGPVAVRSSATAEDMAGASMAGQYDTFLHVRDEAALLDAVGRCWLSLDTPRTRSYLREHGIDISAVAMAVVVQRLVRADVAGVLFTANPRTGSRAEMLAEACWGLGEALVSGRVQPDVLRVDRATGDLLDQRVADKRVMIPFDGDGEIDTPEHLRRVACLGPQHVRELWRLGRKAADHFGGEQDIEWAIEGGTLYLLQSRPVTTLAEADACARIVAETKAALAADLAAGKGPWVRHNLGETLPHPTPLTWSVMRRFMSGAGGFGAMYRLAGFEPSAECRRDGFLRLIGGRVYMDASAAAGMFFERFPFEYDAEALRTNPDAAQAPPTVPTGSFKDRFKAGRRIARINADLAKQAEDLDRRLRHDVFPDLLAYVRREKARDLASLSDAQLAALWRERDARVMGHYAPLTLLPSLVEGMVLADLRAFVAEVTWDEDADELARLLSSSPVPNMTLLADAGLYDVARGRRTVNDWLAKFGHRAAGEFDLSTPRWREQPGLVRATAERLAGGQDPMALHERHAASVRARAEALRDRMGRADAEEFSRRLDRVWRYIVFREDGKYYLMLGYDLLRDVAVEAGRRLGVGDGVFYLSEEEMLAGLAGIAPSGPLSRYAGGGLGRGPDDGTASPHERPPPQPSPGVPGEGVRTERSLAELIAARKLLHRAEARASLPHLIDAAGLPALGEPPKVDAAGTHEAFAVSAGVAVGPARVVMSPHEAGDLGTGYVLVCPSTDPNWTPLFVNAAALVLECGGTLSHGAVVAREMGLPAVVLPDATRILADGQTVRVDGHHGTVGPADGAAASATGTGASPSAAAGSAAPLAYARPGADVRTTPALPAAASDPTDAKIHPSLVPPPASRKDRRAAKLRNVALLAWGVYLLLLFVLPDAWLYRPSLHAVDAAFWWLVPLVGKQWTVAVVAAVVAVSTMVLQRALTDNARLREAKRRAGVLSHEAAGLPPESPRRLAINRLTAPVQARVLAAAMVPLAVGLAPMVLTFLWMPARMD